MKNHAKIEKLRQTSKSLARQEKPIYPRPDSERNQELADMGQQYKKALLPISKLADNWELYDAGDLSGDELKELHTLKNALISSLNHISDFEVFWRHTTAPRITLEKRVMELTADIESMKTRFTENLNGLTAFLGELTETSGAATHLCLVSG